MVTAFRQAQQQPALQPAGWGARVAAYLLDWLVTFILACLFTAAAGLVLLVASDMGRADAPDRAIYAALVVAALVAPVWIIVTLAGWMWQGRSVGKLAMNLRVVDRRGERPGLGRAMVRLVVYVVENLPVAAILPMTVAAVVLRTQSVLPQVLAAFAGALVVPLVSVALALHDRRHRALHDLAAGTAVVAD